jgi:hypothetical protein
MAQSMNAADARRFLAEEIRVVHNIRSQRIIDAIATVRREQFLPPGPWQIKGGDVALSLFSGSMSPSRQTDDADPIPISIGFVFLPGLKHLPHLI